MDSDTFEDSATWAMGAALGFLALLTLLLPRETRSVAAGSRAKQYPETSVDFSLRGDRLVGESRARSETTKGSGNVSLPSK